MTASLRGQCEEAGGAGQASGRELGARGKGGTDGRSRRAKGRRRHAPVAAACPRPGVHSGDHQLGRAASTLGPTLSSGAESLRPQKMGTALNPILQMWKMSRRGVPHSPMAKKG